MAIFVLSMAVFVALISLLLAGPAWVHDPRVSRCNGDDCRPTRSHFGDDGLWRAWNGDKWLTVPPGTSPSTPKG